ncbi:MAG: signal recognition particle-docking protein FtsY [Clostridia bacterium]|nr:signal recognition particle-docking protein FtsY [Clostridia bacterium]MBR5257589.1 signal recognition particle-docking protein FtsY [Clostridia bacterium]
MGLFSRIKQGLSRTRGNVSAQMDELIENTKEIDDDFFEELTDILVMADAGAKTAMEEVEKLKALCAERQIKDPIKAKDALKEVLSSSMKAVPMNLKDPSVIFVIGVNGVGKTTSIGKLASRFKAIGRRVLIVAADTFRAAAAEQLSVWAERAEVPIVKRQEGADPASVVFDGLQTAKARHADIILVDTAGRLHNKSHLMEELRKMARVVEKEYPEAEMHALLVLDATTGQNGLNQARVFMDVTRLDGIILTKLDGTAKGGIALAIRRELDLPVRYIGVGEGLDDLQPFNAEEYIDAIFG